jgi:peptide/nickel transport system substrate-binding protein
MCRWGRLVAIWPRAMALVLGAFLPVIGTGCGSSSENPVAGAAGQPAPGGTLAIALAHAPGNLDPLYADNPSSELITRQVHEPLVESLAGPYGDVRRLPGLAVSEHPSPDRTIWSLDLREGVRFQDGSRFNASAVLANVARWRSTPASSALLPGLVAVDAPRPDLVRFVFSRPEPHAPRLLSSPRLGIVSPAALRSGDDRAISRADRTGTGPFEVRERSTGRVLEARNTAWWGSGRGLGPALDQVEFHYVPDPAERVRLLRAGDVQVAEGLDASELDAAVRDPLITELSGRSGAGLGLERSVRGFDSVGQIPSLSAAWLTRIGQG